WLLGLPTGVLLIVLNRWIPESPRFLLAEGRDEEARLVMSRYGATVLVDDDRSDLAVEERVAGRFAQLFQRPFVGVTTVVVLRGLGVGRGSWGLHLWPPSHRCKRCPPPVPPDRILRASPPVGCPLNFVVPGWWGFWSSKGSILLLPWLTPAALGGFLFAG